MSPARSIFTKIDGADPKAAHLVGSQAAKSRPATADVASAPPSAANPATHSAVGSSPSRVAGTPPTRVRGVW